MLSATGAPFHIAYESGHCLRGKWSRVGGSGWGTPCVRWQNPCFQSENRRSQPITTRSKDTRRGCQRGRTTTLTRGDHTGARGLVDAGPQLGLQVAQLGGPAGLVDGDGEGVGDQRAAVANGRPPTRPTTSAHVDTRFTRWTPSGPARLRVTAGSDSPTRRGRARWRRAAAASSPARRPACRLGTNRATLSVSPVGGGRSAAPTGVMTPARPGVHQFVRDARLVDQAAGGDGDDLLGAGRGGGRRRW